jgi:hypothetical protein
MAAAIELMLQDVTLTRYIRMTFPRWDCDRSSVIMWRIAPHIPFAIGRSSKPEPSLHCVWSALKRNNELFQEILLVLSDELISVYVTVNWPDGALAG